MKKRSISNWMKKSMAAAALCTAFMAGAGVGTIPSHAQGEVSIKATDVSQYYTQSTQGNYTVLTVVKAETTDGKDVDTASVNLSKALNAARNAASASHPYKVVLPAGTYYLNTTLNIFGNTYLYAKDAVIIRDFDGTMLRSGVSADRFSGYNGYKNITIDGGTWDGNAKNNAYTNCNMRFGHLTNLTLKNLSITNNRDTHHMECAGVKGLTVTNCTFAGQYKTKADSKVNMEAIQLDILNTSNHFASFDKNDETPCQDVKIENNTFKNVERGVGSHSLIVGSYHKNISIKNNSFTNVTGYAILAGNYQNAVISGNKIVNAGAGIDVRHYNPNALNMYMSENGTQKACVVNASTKVLNNVISLSTTGNYDGGWGIRILGNAMKDKEDRTTASKIGLKLWDYSISGVTVSNNTIISSGSGIKVYGTQKSVISGNKMTYRKNAAITNGSSGIFVDESDQNTFSKNTITGYPEQGIRTCKGCGNLITGNTVSASKINGIYTMQESDTTIKGNKVTTSTKHGIYANTSSKNIDIISNNVSKSSDSGIAVRTSTGSSIRNNTVSGSKNYGMLICEDTKKITLSGNKISSSKKKNYVLRAGGIRIECSGIGITKVKSAKKKNAKTAVVKWKKTSYATGYEIYRKTGSGKFKKIATVTGGTKTSYTDKKIKKGKKYTYTVRAIAQNKNAILYADYSTTGKKLK